MPASKPLSADAGLDYVDVALLFRAAGLPHSRSSVTRALRSHNCRPRRVTYKTIRFDPDHVQAVIERILKP
jgi:hypothetical protein